MMMMMKFSRCVLAVLALLNRAEAASECCPNGFTGDDCKTEPTPCEPNPCKNGGECVPHFNTVECKCKAGYSGNRCEIDIICASDPCLNGATCVNLMDRYSCECASGWNGTTCEEDIDDCVGNICQNGSTCVDGIAGYTCTCAEGYEGDMCAIDSACIPVSCVNGACKAGNCTCTPGFSGELCDGYTEENSCAPAFGAESNAVYNQEFSTYDQFFDTKKAVTKIKVYYDTLGGGSERQYLHGLEAWYGDDVSTFGGSRNGTEGECALSPGEYITEVKHLDATFDGNTYVGKLEFVTNLKTCGPFGEGEGNMTSVKSDNVVLFILGWNSDAVNAMVLGFLVCP